MDQVGRIGKRHHGLPDFGLCQQWAQLNGKKSSLLHGGRRRVWGW